jgi:NAD(P)H-dependent FMN reductase
VYCGCEDGVSLSRPRNVLRRQRRQQDSARNDMAAQARTCQLKPKIGIILGTTRLTRFSEKAAQWLTNIAKQRDDAEFEIVDLRDYPMPFFEEERSPMFAPPKSAVALRWGKKMAELDGYIFVTAEYNHGLPAVLKNALDYAYAEYNRKPAAIVGDGSAGAPRAVEQLRLALAELQVATLKHTVHVNAAEFMGMLMHGKTFADFPYLGESVAPMLDNLVWWANVLKVGRQPATQPIAVRA